MNMKAIFDLTVFIGHNLFVHLSLKTFHIVPEWQ